VGRAVSGFIRAAGAALFSGRRSARLPHLPAESRDGQYIADCADFDIITCIPYKTAKGGLWYVYAEWKLILNLTTAVGNQPRA
jgi:hypothetical protein